VQLVQAVAPAALILPAGQGTVKSMNKEWLRKRKQKQGTAHQSKQSSHLQQSAEGGGPEYLPATPRGSCQREKEEEEEGGGLQQQSIGCTYRQHMMQHRLS
jgi:hypothetical protein